jgi:iron complex transport system substrate-binding protein
MKNILKKTGVAFMGIVLFTGMLTSCGTSEDTTATQTTAQIQTTTQTQTPTPTPLTITDHFGRVVTIKNSNPQRIVSLAPSNTEILFALGLGDRVVGVTNYCNYPPEATTKPSVGDYTEPNIEVIITMEPELVLATEEHEAMIEQLESHGITVVGLNPKNVDEVLTTITLVGTITSQDDEAASLVEDMQKRINAITAKTNTLSASEKPRVFYIIWHDPIWTVGAETFHDELIQLAGGVNIAHDLIGYVDISLEAVIDSNPQVIIAGVGMGTGEDLPLQFVQTEERLEVIDARQNGRIYSADMDIVSRPGPRIVDALEEFFRMIHPELAD